MRVDLEDALEFAESGLSTGGDRTHATLRRLASAVRCFRGRCDALQAAQKNMRDPERKVVCDILANGFTAQTMPHRLEAPKEPQWSCGVGNCGGGECVHELTDERCPHCGRRMVRVKPTGFMFCSHPATLVCDYEKDFPKGGA